MREEADLDHALHATLALEPPARRLSRLVEFTDATRGEGIHARLARWCGSLNGDYAWVFDNPADTFAAQMSSAMLFGIDVTEFLDNEMTRPPLTLYLFHLVRSLLDGRRFVCWADEFSRLLADPSFEQFAKDGLKVWRKLNGVLAAATQSPSDALASAISRTIIEQTPTKILFPNSDANPQEYMEGFGLSEREFKLIKEQLEPGSRMFLVKQGHYSVVCQLDLKGFDGELKVISGRASSVERPASADGPRGSRSRRLAAYFSARRLANTESKEHASCPRTQVSIALFMIAVTSLGVGPSSRSAMGGRRRGRHCSTGAAVPNAQAAAHDRRERALPGPSAISVDYRWPWHAKSLERHQSQLSAFGLVADCRSDQSDRHRVQRSVGRHPNLPCRQRHLDLAADGGAIRRHSATRYRPPETRRQPCRRYPSKR